ncbi:methyltransferase domain-containing protein [Paraconexibacter antarcticus]|uniref:Methyltransferase domain-containing protein n=1 Tax=Paraconexibacter antarcticus TaxID=2949664 RepID=A0ABY5DRN4_9ACTN|nr:methyltransferase domain-containing protein [Paraconexibacter antarcticus]UTI63234.1 methyltransferase domain-containing protein [Paraconexibacter antarcticus]
MSGLQFDDTAGQDLEALYRTGDAVRRRRLVRRALAAAPGEHVLDAGCGPGFFCAELLGEVGPGGQVSGTDLSPQMLALAERRCAGHENATFRPADATELPLVDATVDAAICVQVLEYVPQVHAALSELRRVLRPGGRVVVWDIDWATLSWYSEDPARMRRVLDAWDEHLVHRTLPRTLGPALRSAGFADVAMQAHVFATSSFDPDTYGAASVPLVRRFVAGRSGVSPAEAEAWADEQRALGDRGEYFFSITQFCFTATRPV